jgi:hypothetical protein
MDGLLKPQIAPFESLSYWFKKPVWKNMEIEKYKWNSETKSVRTTLEHGESLKIGMLFEGQRGFPVKSLRLKGASGEDNYSGESISRQFREYQGAYYVHIYK